MHTRLRRIRGWLAPYVQYVLHESGASVRNTKKLKASFIVTYHNVEPKDQAAFERTVRFLSENFEVVSLDEFLAQVEGRAAAQRDGLVALTFDDGFRNHATVVYPILERLRVPAVFYVCSDLVEHGSLIWTWEVLCDLERLDEAAQKRFFDLAGVSGSLQEIVNWMKTIPVSRREQIQKDIHDCANDSQRTPPSENRFALMTWKQIRSLDPKLITIGSHTATHADLPHTDPERLELELSRSRECLEAQLNRKVEHFAYPNGSITEEITRSVRQYYRSAVTTRPGIVKRGDDIHSLRRIHASFELPQFSWAIAAAAHRARRT